MGVGFSHITREVLAPKSTALGSPPHTVLALVVVWMRDAASPGCAQLLGWFVRVSLQGRRKKLQRGARSLLQCLKDSVSMGCVWGRSSECGASETLLMAQHRLCRASRGRPSSPLHREGVQRGSANWMLI